MGQYRVPIVPPRPSPLSRLSSGFAQGLGLANSLQQMAQQRRQQELAERMQALKEQQMQAQMQAPSAQSPMGKALIDYQNVVQTYGQDSPEAKGMGDYLNKLRTIHQGLSISSQPGGGFQITQGGIQMAPGGMPQAQQPGGPFPGTAAAPSAAGAEGGLVRSPAAPGGRTGQGATLVDTRTGEAASVLGQPAVNTLQKALIASTSLEPNLTDIYSKVAPLVGYSNFVNRSKAGLSHFKGKETPTYDKYLSAVRGDIPLVSDKMLGAMGLRPTNEQVKTVNDAIRPRKDDTKYSYARRFASVISMIALTDKNYMNKLKGALSLSGEKYPKDERKFLEEQYYKQLLGSLEQPSGSPEQPIKMPSFGNKQEAMTWLSQQSPDVLQRLNQGMGG
jgi:hypothetical protein